MSEDEYHELLPRLRVLEKAVETMQLGVTIVDTEQRIVYTNPADAEMHGYTVEELLGRPGRTFAVGGRAKSIRRDELRSMQSWRRETENRHKDGTTFPVEILSDVVLDDAGDPIGIVSICRDLRPQRAAERALRESQERYLLAVRGANDGIWDWDLTTGEFFASPRWVEIIGAEVETLEGAQRDWFDRIHPEDVQHVQQALDEHLEQKAPHFESEFRIATASGDYLWVLSRGLAVRDSHGTPTRIAGSLSDVNGRKVEDPLTGLPNRVLFLDRLTSALARCRRRNRQVGVLFVDLDRFKMVNDSLGHAVGDQLLRQVATVFSSCVRPEDTVARIGGDEFAFLIDDIDDVSQLVQLTERIQNALETVQDVAGKEIFTRASVGIAVGDGGSAAEELLQQADTAMYDAKGRGRARYQIFDRELRQRAQELLELETDLRRTVQADELEVAYQPIVDTRSRTIRGFEALARWNHPEKGPIPPSTFIPVAESTGLIFELGRQILYESCLQLAKWQAETKRARGLKMHVNFSAKQFNYPGLLDQVRGALRISGIAPSALEIEITESAFIDDLTQARHTLEELQALGVKVWLDDFGTGYSSLSYIHRFPVNGLKIDRSFVAELNGTGRELDVTRSIVQLAQNLGIDVVAEGVENRDQADQLSDMACDLVQGFHFGRPLSAREAAGALLATDPTHRDAPA